MSSRIQRLMIALMFALLAAGVTMIIASAQGENPPAAPSEPQDCASCHTDSQDTWLQGAHGESQVVTCDTCHKSALPDHPKSPMMINESPDLCISCHVSQNFGVEDWKNSQHNQLGLQCASCHDPHSTSLKKAAGPRAEITNTDDISALCINCHKESSMDFSYTSHAQRDISCIDCHLNHMESGGAGVPDHSFKASLTSCNTCHAEQMHSPTEAIAPEGSPISAAAEAAIVEAHPNQPASASAPEPVGAMGFSALAGIVGLAGGMVLAPWLERWYQRTVKQSKEEDNE